MCNNKFLNLNNNSHKKKKILNKLNNNHKYKTKYFNNIKKNKLQ